ncbi:hypothetical protein SOVF_039210 [Spinacia oleracea]|nr:hypothetical protein SOVF_039210 [Spinacia oleracea]
MSTGKVYEAKVLELYKKEQIKVKETFSKHAGKISFSVELLREFVSFESFVCISAHYIDEDWKLKKWVLNFFCDSTMDADHPNVVFMKSLKEYGVEGKFLTFSVRDDAVLYVDDLKEQLQEKSSFLLDGKLFPVLCSSDIVSRVVQKGFEEIDGIIDKVKTLSWPRLAKPLWYLTTCNLSKAIELKEMGEFSSVEEGGFAEVPSEEEWGKVKSMCRIADRIYVITKGLFQVEMPTSNLFLPHLQEIRAYLTQESASSDAFVKAAVVLENIYKLYDVYEVQRDQNMYLLGDSSSEEEEDKIGSGKYVMRKWGNNLKDLNVLKEYCDTVQSKYEPEKSDLELYLEEPVVYWMDNFCALKWWKENGLKYPRLSKMARDLLAIPVTLVSSYEAFSIEPREVDRSLMSLKPEVMNAVKCTQSWKSGSKK